MTRLLLFALMLSACTACSASSAPSNAQAEANTAESARTAQLPEPQSISARPNELSAVLPQQSAAEATAAATPSPTTKAAALKAGPEDPKGSPDHSIWDALLRKHVNPQGMVDYAALRSDRAELQRYLNELSSSTPQPDWPEMEQLVYWINAYNAFTIQLILEHYPVKSIRDIDNGNPWDVKWIQLGGKTYSLNQIENDIIRPQFNEPRIHFAVNCAAKSCPPLLNRAWTAAIAERFLEAQTLAFINNPAYNTLSAEKAEVSQIFNWYGADFGDVRAFINQYAKTPVDATTTLQFKSYDWALNAQ